MKKVTKITGLILPKVSRIKCVIEKEWVSEAKKRPKVFGKVKKRLLIDAVEEADEKKSAFSYQKVREKVC